MSRLFWVGVGAAGTVIAARRLRTAWHRYTPAGVAEQVEAAGVGAVAATRSAVDTFRSSFADRQRALVDQLLVTPEGGDASAVIGRRGTARAARAAHDVPDELRPASRPTGRVDDDEPLYDF